MADIFIDRRDFIQGGTFGTIRWTFVRDEDPEAFSSQACHQAQVGAVGVETVTGEWTDKNTFCGKGVAVSVTWLVPTTRYEISWGHHAPAMLALLALLFPRS